MVSDARRIAALSNCALGARKMLIPWLWITILPFGAVARFHWAVVHFLCSWLVCGFSILFSFFFSNFLLLHAHRCYRLRIDVCGGSFPFSICNGFKYGNQLGQLMDQIRAKRGGLWVKVPQLQWNAFNFIPSLNVNYNIMTVLWVAMNNYHLINCDKPQGGCFFYSYEQLHVRCLQLTPVVVVVVGPSRAEWLPGND